MSNEYPEEVRRRNMLEAVQEWFQNRRSLNQKLNYAEIGELVADPVLFSGDGRAATKYMEDQIALFQLLVRQNYIEAELKGGDKRGTLFSFAVVYGLTDKGHQLIQTLPNPHEELQRRLNGIEQAIWALQDPNISQEEKERATTAVNTLRDFGLGLSTNGAYDLLRNLF